MADLASVDDVADLLGLVSSGIDDRQVAALLAQASARFRSEARTEFDSGETSMVLRVEGATVSLPYRPVVSVEAVRLINADGTTGPAMAGWTFDGIAAVTVAADRTVIFNGPTVTPTPTVEVTWTYGFAEVPEDVRWAVASMTARALSAPAAAGVTGETIGAYSWTGGGNAAFALSMTDDEKAVAKRYRPFGTSTVSVL